MPTNQRLLQTSLATHLQCRDHLDVIEQRQGAQRRVGRVVERPVGSDEKVQTEIRIVNTREMLSRAQVRPASLSRPKRCNLSLTDLTKTGADPPPPLVHPTALL